MTDLNLDEIKSGGAGAGTARGGTGMSRWQLLDYVSPSGCAMFQCAGCGGVTKVPTRTCSVGCHDDGPEVVRHGWLYREVCRAATGTVRLWVVPWGDRGRRVEFGALAWERLQQRAGAL